MTVGEGRVVAKEMTMEILRLIAAFVHSAGLLRRSPHPYFPWQNFWIIGAVRLVEVQQLGPARYHEAPLSAVVLGYPS